MENLQKVFVLLLEFFFFVNDLLCRLLIVVIDIHDQLHLLLNQALQRLDLGVEDIVGVFAVLITVVEQLVQLLHVVSRR